MVLGPLNERQRRRHKIRNAAQTALLLGGMVLLLSACAWVIAGWTGVYWTAAASVILLVVAPRISPRMVLAMYRAKEIPPAALPSVYEALRSLAWKAGLENVPRLYYVPSSMLNAFAMGGREDAVIGITDGILRNLDMRELSGVLAHEISHIRNNDLWVMGLADMVGQLTRIMSLAATLLLAFTLPAWLAQGGTIPWLLILLLAFAPTIGSLLQLALSRAREFDADLDAAGLTEDPIGLVSALRKLETLRRGFLERILFPGTRIPEPSLLRTHPSTEERIERLVSLVPAREVLPYRTRQQVFLPAEYPLVTIRPRRRLSGCWY